MLLSFIERTEKAFAKNGKGVYFFVSFVILVALLIFATFLRDASYRRIDFDGETLRLTGVTGNRVRMIDSAGNAAVLTLAAGGIQNGTIAPISLYLTYNNKNISRTRGNFYTFSDGTHWEARLGTSAGFSDGGGTASPLPISSQNQAERNLLHQMLNFHTQNRTIGFYIMIIFFASVIGLMGLVAIFFPTRLWRFRTFWYVHGGEPTDFYIFSNILSGLLFILIAFALIFIFV